MSSRSPVPPPPFHRRSVRGFDFSPLLQQAFALRARGDLHGAEARLRQILRHDPQNPAALNALGNVAVARKRYDLAIDYHRRAAKAAPKDAAVLNDLANSLILAGAPQDALSYLRKALKIKPRLRPALFNLARAHRNLNEPERALKILEQLGGTAGPEGSLGQIDVMLETALTFAQAGRAKDAVALFRAVLDIRSADPKALDGLATCHPASAADNDLHRVEAALGQSGLTPLQRTVAHRAAGKILEDLHVYDEAFEQFRMANEASGRRFDMKLHEDFIAGSIRLFTRGFFEQRARFGDPSERPVFVVGLPRSGTTLVEQILASHPQVDGLGELPDIERGLRSSTAAPFGSDRFFDKIRDFTAATVGEHAKAYLATLSGRSSKSRAVDKMPHNFLVLGWIALLFPKARIVHVRRNPIDVCVSCYKHHFSDAHAYSNDLRTLGEYYRSYDKLMRHWSAALPLSVLDVQYEEIVADLEQSSRRMVAHVGLEWDPSCLDFHRTDRIIQTPSRWQVRQPLYASSVGHWRRYERHLQPLLEGLQPEQDGAG